MLSGALIIILSEHMHILQNIVIILMSYMKAPINQPSLAHTWRGTFLHVLAFDRNKARFGKNTFMPPSHPPPVA